MLSSELYKKTHNKYDPFNYTEVLNLNESSIYHYFRMKACEVTLCDNRSYERLNAAFIS